MSDLYLLLVAVALAVILLILMAVFKVAPRHKQPPLNKRFIQMKWQEVVDMAGKTDQSARFAVIEADKLLDYVLKARGYKGETMADRLRSAGTDFTYRDDVWSAHKLRNRLVHEADYRFDKRLITRSINQFQQALKDLGAI